MWVEILLLERLRHGPSHGYDLKRHVARATGLGDTLNNNTVYPALRRLRDLGAVESAEVPQPSRPPRHVYRATERGVQLLKEMLAELPPELAGDDAEFHVRIAFFGEVTPQARAAVLHSRKQWLERIREQMTQNLARLEQESWAAETVRFQLARADLELEWVTNLPNAMSGKPHASQHE